MASPVSNSSALNTQTTEEKKKVTWGNNTVVVIDLSYHVPDRCSEANEGYLSQLMESRSTLLRSMSQPKSNASKAHVITVLRNIISSTAGSSDPITQTINRVSHVFLGRAYFGMYCGAFLAEMKVIEADPEMKKLNDRWQQLLTAESIFA